MKKIIMWRLKKLGFGFVDAVIIYNKLSFDGAQYVSRKKLIKYIEEVHAI